ncbi:hypothetical protein Ccrd_009783 [Cynara cardunculus var. scolymus]|uniref:Uncharacterized protein n=1 Tax=Cynara cardunculus var. scolymus TaxID=59895 RepID=A0A118K776_CYNCS|nr:hypothetical protein Ccrd_009783 [Cynara cardunculus var. scolymus]
MVVFGDCLRVIFVLEIIKHFMFCLLFYFGNSRSPLLLETSHSQSEKMKITGKTDLPAIISSKVLNFTPDSDLLQKPISRKQVSRKSRNSGGGVRLRRDGVPAGGKRGSRPETPLLRWKFDEGKGKEEKDVEVKNCNVNQLICS